MRTLIPPVASSWLVLENLMEMSMNTWKTGLVAAGLLTLAGASHATAVVGGSDLLGAVYAEQLTDWLGQGSLTLTNIFDKTADDTGYDFHAAVDGKGATFAVFEVTSSLNQTTYIVGGYNPTSWFSTANISTSYNITYAAADRTAFIFNLTTGAKNDQSKGLYGEYQTNNLDSYGPTFGAGHDLYVDSSLATGYASSFTYGKRINYGDPDVNIVDGTNGDRAADYSVGKLEVFSIAPSAAVAAVPEPGTYALMLTGLAVLGASVRRKRRRATFCGCA